jgi:hypothetical protein
LRIGEAIGWVISRTSTMRMWASPYAADELWTLLN